MAARCCGCRRTFNKNPVNVPPRYIKEAPGDPLPGADEGEQGDGDFLVAVGLTGGGSGFIRAMNPSPLPGFPYGSGALEVPWPLGGP